MGRKESIGQSDGDEGGQAPNRSEPATRDEVTALLTVGGVSRGRARKLAERAAGQLSGDEIREAADTAAASSRANLGGYLATLIQDLIEQAEQRAAAEAAKAQREAASELEQTEAAIEAGDVPDDELRAAYPTAEPELLRGDRAFRREAARRLVLRRRREREVVPA